MTAVILAAVTGASFIFWILPQENPSTFVVSDYGGYLDGVKKIHEVIEESVEMDFEDMLDGTITPEQYAESSGVASSQVTAQITEFVKSGPPEQWQESYISYMEALKKFNTYIVETRVAAGMMGTNPDGLNESLQKIETLKKEYRELADLSDGTRP